MKLFSPFENVSKKSSTLIGLGWIVLLMGTWIAYGTGETHLFPTMSQVIGGFADLWNAGLVTHIFSSLFLCGKAVVLSVFISLILAYFSTLPVIKPVSNMVSKFRYLPLTGITFYITMVVSDGRSIQVWILVIFMTTYLVTSLLSTLTDIKEEEFDHARALGCTRWEMLWEVVIKGRLDYVIECIRQNFAMIWFALVTVESILAASGGIGFLIKNSDKFMNHGRIIALQLIILAIGISIDKSLSFTRRAIFRYSKF